MSTNSRRTREKSWVEAELEDSLDEELEMELDDERIPRELRQITGRKQEPAIDRRLYFHELLRLQSELVKLQDWVVHTKYKLVVIFEGRDAAGKGGVIKRITQRLNPRACRVVALPAPSDREKNSMVLPTLRFPPADRRRDRAVRPLLVQSRWRRTRHGIRDARAGR